MSTRPNVILMLSDQHSHRILGHVGHPDVRTPHLDRLAAEGVRCAHAITANPICTPSRVSWLSGQYCHNHGYYGLCGPNPQGLPTVFGHFRRFGYRTAAIGKIHCPEYWVEDDCDIYHETGAGNHLGTGSVGGRSLEYQRFLDERDAAEREDHQLPRQRARRYAGRIDAEASQATHAESQDGWATDKAIDTMTRAQADGQPFFLHLSLPRPHQNYAPSREFWDLYDESALRLPPTFDADLTGKAPHLRLMAERARSQPGVFDPADRESLARRKLHGYLGQVSEVDHCVGRVLDFLHASRLADNTVFIYSTDHGEYAMEWGLLEKAPGICSDSVCRIPMLWRLPGVLPAGRTCDALVETVDTANTLCALCGIEAMPTADGHDITPLLRGEVAGVRETALTEFALSKSITDGRYRLVFYPDDFFAAEHPGGFGELYDLAEDPWERHNRWHDPALGAVRGRLQHALLNRLVRSTRPVTVLPPMGGAGIGYRTRHHCALAGDGKVTLTRLDQLVERGANNYL